MRRTSWVEKPEQADSSPRRKRAVVACPLSPWLRFAVLYLLLVSAHTGYFVWQYGGGYWAVLVSAPAGFVLGAGCHLFWQGVTWLRQRLLRLMRPLLAGFLLFFLFLVAYILAFSGIVSLPVEWCVSVQTGSARLARQYVLYSMNLVMVLAILSWLRWILTVEGLRNKPME